MKLLKKILKFSLSRDKINPFEDFDASKNYNVSGSKGLFITGVGRSGTHFMADLLGLSDKTLSYHMDQIGDSVGDSFNFFSKWNDLDLDYSSFKLSRSFLIDKAIATNKLYVESNPMIAFNLIELNAICNSVFIIMYRSPINVIESHFKKGWYKTVISQPSRGKNLSYNYFLNKPNHFFSRIEPREIDERKRWLGYGRIGKIAWMWRVTYMRIFDQLKNISNSNLNFIKLENFNYESYVNLLDKLEIDYVSKDAFNKMVKVKPGRGVNKEEIVWTNKDIKEYNGEMELAKTAFRKYGFIDLDTVDLK